MSGFENPRKEITLPSSSLFPFGLAMLKLLVSQGFKPKRVLHL